MSAKLLIKAVDSYPFLIFFRMSSKDTPSGAATLTLKNCCRLSRDVLAALLSLSLGACSFEESKESKEEKDQIMAFVQCQNYVRERLKAPSTAKFPLLDRSVLKIGENVYEVTSYVDAQNSFGAQLRKNYVCNIKRTDLEGERADPRSWQLVDLSID